MGIKERERGTTYLSQRGLELFLAIRIQLPAGRSPRWPALPRLYSSTFLDYGSVTNVGVVGYLSGGRTIFFSSVLLPQAA
jgi:hypothetical protein